MPYALAIAFFGGLMEILPYIGPILAAIPAILIGLLVSPVLGVSAFIFYVIAHQIEAHIVAPQVMKHSAGLNPVALIVAILIGAELAGPLGIILSVPITMMLSVFVEDFFSRRPSAEKDKIRDYLSVNTPAGIVVWEAKDVSSQLKTYPVASVRKFELPKYVFQFLDSFSLPALRSALSTTAPELVFSLLSGHLHKLIMVKDGIGSFPSWQQSKLRSLASRFTLGLLLKMNEELLTIDLKQKTSSAPYSLSAALELFTVKINN